MDFLESAAVLIPALTGIEVTIYDGKPETLTWFEQRYCFSPQLQRIYSAEGLKTFLERHADAFIYDLVEPLGSRLITFKSGNGHVLLGPYVEESWREHSARVLLTKLGISEANLQRYKAYRCNLPIIQQEFGVKTAFLLAEHLGCGSKMVKTIQLEQRDKGTPVVLSDVFSNADEVRRRYQWEDRFVAAVSQGDAGTAHKISDAFGTVSAGIRFLSDSMQDQLAGAAVRRTLIRFGAKQGGLSPVLIDSISQEYAQRMRQTASKEELERLNSEMITCICDEVYKQRCSKWSSAVRKAVDYLQVNLSKAMTMEEISRAAGVDRHRLSKDFLRETGKSVKRYLAMRRCEVAAGLLLDSSASVQEIAAYVGYEDANYFSKVFTANHGVSPQIYRTIHGTFFQTK